MRRQTLNAPYFAVVAGCQATIAAVTAAWAYEGEGLNVAIGATALLLSELPLRIIRHQDLRNVSACVVASLLGAHVLLGMLLGLYDSSLGYDKFMHVIGSSAVAFVAATALRAHVEERSVHLSRPLIAIGIFAVTLSAGALWEIFEFAVDLTGLFFAQRGLRDTMIDLIADCIGALIALVLFLGPTANRGRPIFQLPGDQ